MGCRTGLGVLVLTLGLGVAGMAAAQEPPAPPPPAEEGQPPGAEGQTPAEGEGEVAGEAKKTEKPQQTQQTQQTQQPPAQDAPAQPGTTGTAPEAPPGAAPVESAPTGVAFEASAVGEAGDKVEEEDEGLPPRVPWRGTRLDWINSATTTMLNVGRDTIGHDHEAYGMLWWLTLQYYLVDLDFWNFRVQTAPVLAVELTNADDTTTEREPQFLDLPLLGVFGLNAYKNGLWTTTPTFTGGLIFPTWKYSYSNGTLLTTTNRVGLAQGIPLLGEDSPALKSFSITGQFRWDHRFSRATTGVSDDVLERERQGLDTTGAIVGASQVDQLSGSRLGRDTLRESVGVGFSEALAGMPLSFDVRFLFSQVFKPALPEGRCVILATGPACPDHLENAEDTQYYNGFSAEIGFIPVPELGIALGYSSSNSPIGQNQLAPDGTRAGFFYTPSAEFSATLTFYPDALYERATGPKRKLAEGEKKKKAF